jgi:hypothetical protein
MEAFSHYVNAHEPPTKRQKGCDGTEEHHLTEGAVMIAFAMYLFDQGADHVQICPDGTHGQIHDVKATLKAQGFELIAARGTTVYGGEYQRGKQILIVKLLPGVGDVSAEINNQKYVVECKGGIINTSRSGQTSRLRKGLCEAIGQLMTRDLGEEIHIAAVPHTKTTKALALKMKDRVTKAGIKVALVDGTGVIHFP